MGITSWGEAHTWRWESSIFGGEGEDEADWEENSPNPPASEAILMLGRSFLGLEKRNLWGGNPEKGEAEADAMFGLCKVCYCGWVSHHTSFVPEAILTVHLVDSYPWFLDFICNLMYDDKVNYIYIYIWYFRGKKSLKGFFLFGGKCSQTFP